MPDLLVLAADLDMEFTLRGLLARPQSFNMRNITCTIKTHPNHDAGCLNDAPGFLQSYIRDHQYALVLFDYHGCGHENRDSPEDIQVNLEGRLRDRGWEDRARVVVIPPELEIWIWSESSEVDNILGWAGKTPALRDWLRGQNLLAEKASKPDDPKRAFKAAVEHVGTRHSPRLFRELAERVSVNRCTDSSFSRLKETLLGWFRQT